MICRSQNTGVVQSEEQALAWTVRLLGAMQAAVKKHVTNMWQSEVNKSVQLSQAGIES